MQVPPEVKPACWGAAGGAIALAIIGFNWGGWVTGGTAELKASQRAELAVVTALAPICVDKFRQHANADAESRRAEKDELVATGFVHREGRLGDDARQQLARFGGRACVRRDARSDKVVTMALSFPNRSRSFDATRRAVRFWGHDSAMESSFFVTEDALKRVQPDMRLDESWSLERLRLQSRLDSRGRRASLFARSQRLLRIARGRLSRERAHARASRGGAAEDVSAGMVQREAISPSRRAPV